VSGRLEGKVAVVTGTSPNIGGALACGLAAAGAHVACNDVDEASATAVAERIERAGGQAMPLVFDVTDEVGARAGVDAALDRWGHVDILVNNAVKFDFGGVLDMPIARFQRQVEIIQTGALIMSQLVANAMVERQVRGSIVNILSTAAWQGHAGNIGYSTAKSGLINFTRTAAMELAPFGIRVNALTPTVTIPDDPEIGARFRELLVTAAETGGMDFEGRMPWHRLPQATDYVGPLVFLASDDAEFVNGSNLMVDGGAMAQYWPQTPARFKDRAPAVS
jgi:NAD(P)-dependent dehydrogenase (short-subunit alcohol dehydrogenase family)